MADESPDKSLALDLDRLAVDILLMTRTVNIYPVGHPVVAEICKRLAHWADNSKGTDGVTIGVTGSELIVDEQFYGGAESRLEMLAKRFHKKNIARLTWKAGITNEEIYQFAKFLSDPDLKGGDLVQAMAESEIRNILVVPLDINALHERMRTVDVDYAETDRVRKRQVWRWLHEMAGTPQELARNMAKESFWNDAFSTDEQIRDEFIYLLSNVGTMIDNAIQALPPEKYEMVLDKLTHLGENLDPQQVAKLIDTYMSEGSASELALMTLMKNVNGERMAAVLGGMVTLGENREERIASFIDKFVPKEDFVGLTGLVGEWKNLTEVHGLKSDVWEWLETFLSDTDGSAFMGGGYKATLEHMAEKMKYSGGHAIAFGFYEDPEAHLDHISASLAVIDPEYGGDILSARISERVDSLDLTGLIKFLDVVDHIAPEIFRTREDIFEKIFLDIAGNVKDLSTDSRESIYRFARRHHDQSIDLILKALSTEESLSARRFLVEVLAQMPRTVLPKVVLSAKNAPWYYIRNIAIAIGQMGDPRALPFLKSLLSHTNPKLRKEAIRSLSRINDPYSRKILLEYADRSDIARDEASMARSAAERIGEI